MKNADCNVVRDLMPLVLDRAASDESRETVEMHIGSCEDCRKQYEAMKADMPDENRKEYEQEQLNFITALKAVHAKQRRRKIGLLTLVFAVVLAAILGGGLLLSRLNQNVQPVDIDKYSITLSQLNNGKIVVTEDLRFNATRRVMTSRTETEDGKTICYISINVAPLQYISNGEILGKSDYSVWDASDIPDEVRQGTPDRYKTVRTAGEPIPAASEEMEAYFALEEKMYPARYESEINASELDTARELVPEWQWGYRQIRASEYKITHVNRAGESLSCSWLHPAENGRGGFWYYVLDFDSEGGIAAVLQDFYDPESEPIVSLYARHGQ